VSWYRIFDKRLFAFSRSFRVAPKVISMTFERYSTINKGSTANASLATPLGLAGESTSVMAMGFEVYFISRVWRRTSISSDRGSLVTKWLQLWWWIICLLKPVDWLLSPRLFGVARKSQNRVPTPEQGCGRSNGVALLTSAKKLYANYFISRQLDMVSGYQ
jgi:hypothetical protein